MWDIKCESIGGVGQFKPCQVAKKRKQVNSLVHES